MKDKSVPRQDTKAAHHRPVACFRADDPSFAVVVQVSSRKRWKFVVACDEIRCRGRRGIREKEELREDVRHGRVERG